MYALKKLILVLNVLFVLFTINVYLVMISKSIMKHAQIAIHYNILIIKLNALNVLLKTTKELDAYIVITIFVVHAKTKKNQK